ncbi:FAD-dependent oxidoreductase [Arabiibacter massiliensis]|uniref:FAD-dependent oxidoreductase n=1 Tax=Arabiibacter massiliensis TaxID=1870985 RepID=UPI0009BB378B|nr:FAD-dependent oxidoreductase [Arabiibacter massiliensis]
MEHFDAAIIGFGTAGRALGGALADAGQTVAVIEQSERMYGGACVNNACIPTKALVHSARLSAAMGGSIVEREERYAAAIDDMNKLRDSARERNYHSLADRPNVAVIDGRAAFTGPLALTAATADGTREIDADRVFIDTGSLPSLPAIPGIDSPRVHVSSSLIDVRTLPRQLVVIGGGYVGLEFASMYADFGAQVTVLQRGPAILEHEDGETAEAVRKSLADRGIQLICDADVERIDDEHDQVLVHARIGGANGAERRFPAHAVLAATGRTPNTAGLNLEAAGIELGERGGIRTDEHLRTTAPGVWAMGDAAGSPQFTYIAYDDFRIVRDDVLGDGARTTENRGAIPRCTFVHPPFARIGATAQEARDAGFTVRTATLPAAGIGQARILRDETGLMKAVVDANSDLVLGMDLFCEDAQELVNLVKIVMDARIPATALRDAVFTHPSMTEAFNNLFAALRDAG